MRFIFIIAKHLNAIYRCISCAGIILVLLLSVFNILNQNYSFNDFRIYLNIFALILFFVLLIFPEKIELLSIVSLAFSIEGFLISRFYENPIGLFLYVLTCAILFSRGYYRKFRIRKIIISILFGLLLFAFQFQFGIQEFLKSLFTLAEYSFVIFLILFFYYLYLKNQGKSPIEKYLDLTQFPDLTKRDKEWLNLIQKETKYSTIAAEYNVSLGTVKNRMRYIFDVIGVSDRIGFMATYGGFELKS